jgi:hypothetical protein
MELHPIVKQEYTASMQLVLHYYYYSNSKIKDGF